MMNFYELLTLLVYIWSPNVVRCQVPMNNMDQLNIGNSLHDYNWVVESFMHNIQDYLDGITDSQCKTDLNKVYTSLLKGEKWALQMIDAWAKPQTGLLTGNFMHMGRFDECIGIHHEISKDSAIFGQYCTAVLLSSEEIFNNTGKHSQLGYFLKSLHNSWGICVPTSCNDTILEDLWNYTARYLNLDFHFSIDDGNCYYEGKRSIPTITIVAIITFSMCILIVLAASCYDLFTSKRQDRNKFLIAFSALTNGRNILLKPSSDKQITCLNGIRVMSMFWVIVGHRFLFFYYTPHINGDVVKEWTQKTENMIIFSAGYAVDTFFVVGGLLVSYLFFQTKDDGMEINIPMYYIHRLLRLTPSLAAVVLFFATILEYMGDGPFWPIIHHLFQLDCQNNWWATLLYIQNFLYPEDQCVLHAWYLAVDTQLYFIAPVFLFPLLKWPKTTLTIIVLLILSSLGYTFAYTWIYELGSNYLDAKPEYRYFHMGTQFRASAWLIGFAMGYVLFKLKYKKVTLKKSVVVSMWLISLGTTSAVIFSHVTFTRNEYDVVKSSIFNTFSRPAWCLAVCWIIFTCVKGYGGLVNKILSLSIFNVIIRINYNMYLLHVVTLVYFLCQEKATTHFRNDDQLHVVCADMVTTSVLAFFWTLVFESPVIALERIVFNKDNPDDAKKHITLQDHQHLANFYVIPK